MYSERQKQMLGEITRGLGLAAPKPDAVAVEQSPGYVDSVIETADFAVAALGGEVRRPYTLPCETTTTSARECDQMEPRAVPSYRLPL